MIQEPHTAFFGDAEYPFRLTTKMTLELERVTGAGIGALCTRVFNKQFTHSDISETLRLSLIGAGMSPERAASLIAIYAVDRPLIETYPTAVAVLELGWFGHPKHEVANG
jgi:hypothetical protein